MVKAYLKLALRYRVSWLLSVLLALLALLPFGMVIPAGNYNCSKERDGGNLGRSSW